MDSLIIRITNTPIDTSTIKKEKGRTLDEKYREIQDIESFKRRSDKVKKNPNL